MVAGLVVCGFTVAACKAPIGAGSHTAAETVHDDELTVDDFDYTLDFDAHDGEPLADAPVPVHEFDADKVEKGGGVKVIDGQDWLNADDFERNEMLVKAQESLPEDAIFVIVVATGEVWALPPAGGFDLITIGAVKEWDFGEYYRLADYVGQPQMQRITFTDFYRQTEIANERALGKIYVVHDIGLQGYKEIEASHGFQALSPYLWNGASPQLRYSWLHSIQEFNSHVPAFQGEGNRPAFGVSVPWGSVYVMPSRNYESLAGTSLRLWTQYQITSLPTVLTGTDRPIRNEDITIKLDFKP